MTFRTVMILILFTFFLVGEVSPLHSKTHSKSHEILKVGNPLPNAILSQYQKEDFRLIEARGRVKIISVVPQLNTPVCDEQTHRFSEDNGGLDRHVQLITISTNSAEGQASFAKKAGINNMLFLSDRPNFDFGEQTGLLNRDFGYLKRTVIVADKNNIIRYVDFVPGGGMPQIKKALKAAKFIAEE
ncbi:MULTISPECIES: redoxin domain-containing protein [unclassified Nitrospina]|uniref:redoxin domain-containing protein n=1 Tax=unclassified Nitrospina TaxID=2638683 RepID=UPI003F9B8C3C